MYTSFKTIILNHNNNIFNVYFYLCVYVYVWVSLSVTVYENFQRPEEGIISSLLELQTVGHHPQEEQQMLFNPWAISAGAEQYSTLPELASYVAWCRMLTWHAWGLSSTPSILKKRARIPSGLIHLDNKNRKITHWEWELREKKQKKKSNRKNGLVK